VPAKTRGPVEIFNLASEGVTRVSFIAEEVIRQSGGSAKIRYTGGDRGWVGDVPYTWLDGSRVQALGWTPKLNSDEAVRRAVKEILEETK
jgi:UDP-glucose 4-epimerase